VSLVYEELLSRAGRLIRNERDGHTLSPRDLVHETYLRLFGSDEIEWQDRRQFFAIAVRRMRQILINHAKRRKVRFRFFARARDELRDKGWRRDELEMEPDEVSQALAELERGGERSRRLGQIIELKFFGGLKHGEIAEQLDVSTKTVQRDLEAGLAVLLARVRRAGQ